jgi:hypothetical protein
MWHRRRRQFLAEVAEVAEAQSDGEDIWALTFFNARNVIDAMNRVRTSNDTWAKRVVGALHELAVWTEHPHSHEMCLTCDNMVFTRKEKPAGFVVLHARCDEPGIIIVHGLCQACCWRYRGEVMLARVLNIYKRRLIDGMRYMPFMDQVVE